MAELTQVLTKRLANKPHDPDNITKEIADVLNTLQQLIYTFNIQNQVDEIRKVKTNC